MNKKNINIYNNVFKDDSSYSDEHKICGFVHLIFDLKRRNIQMEWNKMGKRIKAISIIAGVILLMQCTRGTEKKYLSHTIAPDSIYTKDSIYLEKVTMYFMFNRIGIFGGCKYFDKYTKLYLDTIIYSPDLNKIAFWAITKDSVNKMTDVKMPQIFGCNGYVFCAIRKSIKDPFMVYDNSNYAIVFCDSYKEAHASLYEESFLTRRYSNKRSNPESAHNYDDIRFWQEPLWQMILEDTHWYISDTGVKKIN